jgi:hypothetical protein
VGPIVRTVGSAVYNQGWITDPLNAPELGSDSWVFHLWASQSDLLANIGLQVDIETFSGTSIVSAASPELGLTSSDIALTSGAATPINLGYGDRIVIRVSLASAGGIMATGYTSTFSYNAAYGRAEGDSYVICPDNLATADEIPDDDKLSVRSILQDQGQANPQLEDDDIVRYIRQALATYSVDRPRITAYYYSGDGTTFDFPLPPKWVWGFSMIKGAEYPADQQIPEILDTIDWELREGVLGIQPTRFIRFRTNVPDRGTNNVWVQYTAPHEYSSEYSTIPVEDFDALLWLAASYCAVKLASKGAGSTDSTLSADVVNYQNAEQKWGAVAKRLKDMYLNRVVSPDSATPVGSTVEWKPILSTGMNFLWHSRRVRRIR